MTKQRIVELWLKGYTKEYLMREQAKDLKYSDEGKGKKAVEIKYMAQSDVEQALLNWWRKQGEV